MAHVYVLAATALLSLAGCGESALHTLRSSSAGYVGCPADEIEVTNDDVGPRGGAWDATCRGRLYHCSALANGGMSCVEDRPVVDPALRTTASSLVGCPVDEVVITNDRARFNQRSWNATCRGRTFRCSAMARATPSCVAEDGKAELGLESSASHLAPDDAGAAHTWLRYRITDCGVSFLLPGNPREERRATTTKVGAVETVSANVNLADGGASVSCATLPQVSGTVDTARVFDGVRNDILKKPGAVVESERDIRSNDFIGREIRFSLNGSRARARLYLQGRRVVTMVLMPIESFIGAEVENFFESLAPSSKLPTADNLL